MRSEAKQATDDQGYLDRLYDHIVELVEDGRPVVDLALEEGREHLRPQVDRLIRLAQSVAPGRAPALPAIPGYTILGELGHGGMGSVYLAQQEKLGGRSVALKMLPPAVALSPNARARFRAEAHAIARLRHPNIVAVHDVVDEGGLYAYAMEWVDGRSLAELIEHLKRLDRDPSAEEAAAFLSDTADASVGNSYPIFVCRIGIAMARALGAVHREGLLHRDVKPSNILLRCDGTPLLSDFGLARDTDSTVLTQEGQFLGTLAYAAPEQLRGETRELNERTDIYALGVTLYHALALRVPFVGSNTGQILHQIERGLAPSLRKLNSRLPAELQTIVAKAMDADPARRYTTADELADDLERLLNLQPIHARPAGMVTRTLKLTKRNRRALGGAIGGGILAFVLAAAFGFYVFVLPGWVEEHVREARLALLDPVSTDLIFMSLLWGSGSSRGQPLGFSADFCAASLSHYDRARRFAPFDDSIRRERAIVTTARELCVSNRASEGLLKQFAQSAPLTVGYARDWAAAGGMPAIYDRSELQGAGVSDLRALGLLAFVCADTENALAVWSEYDQSGDPDPLVEAAVGLLHLVNDEPQRAYPRLRDACQAFPDVGFLHVSLADAALQCGDVQRAELLLERAAGMDRLDQTEGLERVWADLYVATGREEQALEVWRSHSNSVASYHRGLYLEERGDFGGAMRAYGHAGGPGDYRRAWDGFRRAAPRWWEGLTREQRWQALRDTLDELPSTPGQFPRHSLLANLLSYADYVVLPALADPSAERPIGDPWQAGSLGAIALALRAPRPSIRAGVFLHYPPLLKDLQATVLLSPWPIRGSLLLAAIDEVGRGLNLPSWNHQ